jgi:hypothetical protein
MRLSIVGNGIKTTATLAIQNDVLDVEERVRQTEKY